MPRVSKLIAPLSIMIVFMLLLSVTSVFAAPLEKAKQTQFSYIGGGMDTVGMLRVVLPEGTPLPVDVKVAVPTGSAIAWAGEIMGDDPKGDITATYSLLETKGIYDYYIMNVKKSAVAQIEFSGRPVTSNTPDGNAQLALEYAPALPTDELTIAVEVPVTATVQNQDAVPLGKGMSGQVYGKTFNNVAADASNQLAVVYKAQTAEEAGRKAGNTGENDIYLIVGILGGLALIGGIIIVAATKRKKVSTVSTVPSAAQLKKVKMKAATPTSAPKAASSSTAAAPKKSAKKMAGIVTAAIVVIGLAGFAIAASLNTSTTKLGNTYFREFAQGEPCAEANFGLTEAALANPEKSADELFDTMEKADFEILSATLDPDNKLLNVKFCESKTDENRINDLIEPSGMVVLQSLPLYTATPGPEGTIDYYFSKTGPCAITVIAVGGDLPADDNEKVARVGESLKAVPSMALLRYNPAVGTFEVGFCDEQTNDNEIVAAITAAGLMAEVKTPMVILNQQQQ